jgi:hypothetical protein
MPGNRNMADSTLQKISLFYFLFLKIELFVTKIFELLKLQNF